MTFLKNIGIVRKDFNSLASVNKYKIGGGQNTLEQVTPFTLNKEKIK